jgi:hypothetical protein
VLGCDLKRVLERWRGLCPNQRRSLPARNSAPERCIHRIKTPSARTPPLALPTLPIEYQYFKFRIIAISSGNDGSSCFNII